VPKTIVHTVRDERAIRGGRRVLLQFQVGADTVPAALLLPTSPIPAPATLLLHGYTSRKERMIESVGQALLGHGIASLAIDLPLHGERHEPLERESLNNPLGLVRRWNAALAECRAALRYLADRPDIDGERLALVGYSLGSYLGVMVAAREPSVRALVLAAGGDLPETTPYARIIRAVVDPARAVRKLAGRPLLMVNGRNDRTIRPSQAERLFAAAREPKEIQWWDAGHWLPQGAIEGAAKWLSKRVHSE
jgi:dienelactone hydrolase